jgi:hypothetical protein
LRRNKSPDVRVQSKPVGHVTRRKASQGWGRPCTAIQIAQSGHDPEPAFMRTANGKLAAAWTVPVEGVIESFVVVRNSLMAEPFEHFTSAPRST